MFKQIGKGAHNVAKEVERAAKTVGEKADETNLAHATADQVQASEAIKQDVRNKIAQLTEKNQHHSEYANLKKLADDIEAKHDQIYKRSESGTNPGAASEECKKWLAEEQALKSSFDEAYGKVLNAPASPKNRVG